MATGSAAYFPFLMQSVSRHGDTIDVLGWGRTWRGFAWRQQLVAEYLDALDPEECVCVVDAYDVLMLRPLSELECAFRRFADGARKTIVTGSEKSDLALMRFVQRLIFSTCRGQLLNAGTVIGRVRDLRDMVHGMLCESSSDDDDDQALMTGFCKANQGVHVDTSNRFFLTILRPLQSFLKDANIVVRGGQVWYRGHRPFFAHGNGQTNMNELVRSLGYDLTSEHAACINRYLRKTTFKKVFVYLPHVWHYALSLLCCCLLACCAAWTRARRWR